MYKRAEVQVLLLEGHDMIGVMLVYRCLRALDFLSFAGVLSKNIDLAPPLLQEIPKKFNPPPSHHISPTALDHETKWRERGGTISLCAYGTTRPRASGVSRAVVRQTNKKEKM